MKAKHSARVDAWVCDVLGLQDKKLWRPGVTVAMHSRPDQSSAIVVVGRDDTAHISLPEWAAKKKLAEALADESPSDLLDAKFWKKHKITGDDHQVSGPQVHNFTSTPLEMPRKVEQIPVSEVAHWRDLLSRRKWERSGFADQVPVAFAIRSGDEIAAAANLTTFLGVPSDVGVLTHPKYRGKGYASRVARGAASYAVAHHGLARYRADADDARAQGIALSLGFEPYFQYLTVTVL